MIISKNTKEQIISKLVNKYGEDFKTPLARALGVNVSTVRRWFNSDKDLDQVTKKAILCILDHSHLCNK